MSCEIVTQSADETKSVAAEIGARLQAGQIVLLSGKLGAGKTTFVQGIAHGLGIDTPVTSPTFTIIHEYHGGSVALIHIDCYRLDGPNDVESLGWDEIITRGEIVIVEWPERLGFLTPQERLEVSISTTGDSTRLIRLLPSGAEYEQLVKSLC